MTWWRTSRRVRERARTVRGVPQTKSPRGVSFLEREEERERKREDLGRDGEEKGVPASFASRDLGPTRARHLRTVHGAHTDGPRGAQTVRRPGADSPLFVPEHPVLPLSPPSGRTVRPTAADSPTFLFFFSLIYSEIKT
jgi:hypothetical protein